MPHVPHKVSGLPAVCFGASGLGLALCFTHGRRLQEILLVNYKCDLENQRNRRFHQLPSPSSSVTMTITIPEHLLRQIETVVYFRIAGS